MAFYEVAHGYVGLGSTTVHRTTAQATADLLTYGDLVKDISQQGGLRNLETAFIGAASFGRVKQLENEIAVTEKRIKHLENEIDIHIEYISRLSGTDLWSTVKSKSQMYMPVLWMNMAIFEFFGDLFGDLFGKKRKKEAIKRHSEYVRQMVNERAALVSRHEKLVQEVQTLMTKVETGEVSARLVESTAEQKQREKAEIDAVKLKKATPTASILSPLLPQSHIHATKKPAAITPVPEKFAFAETLEQRKTKTSAATALPVGVQQIFSPALKHGSILATASTRQREGQTAEVVTGQRLVHGGLGDVNASIVQDRIAPLVPMVMTFGLGLMLVQLLANESRQPLRVRQVYAPRRRLA